MPIGANGQTRFKHIFRGWISNGINNVIPGNGSTHGWSRFELPPSIIDLNNLYMVVFVTKLSGEVLDCTMVSAGPAPSYALSSSNATKAQSTLCDSIVVPGIRIKNTGVNPIAGVALKTTIGDSTYMDFRSDTISPAEEKTFLLEERTTLLNRGTHYIDVKVDYILNAPGQGNITSTNAPVRYLVGRAHTWEDEGFENLPDGSFGPIIVRKKVNEAVQIVDSEDIGSDTPVGAYGLSDHALMVDLWTWPWDEDDAGNAFLVDNKNFAYLYFDHFPLDHIKQPILKFDVASANKPNHKCIEVAGRPFTCSNNPSIIKTLTGNDIISTAANTSSRYIPKPEEWRTHTVDLYRIKNSTQTHLRLKFTNYVDFTKPNAFYIDNLRVESNERICVLDSSVFKTQVELDSFLLSQPDCNTIDGDLQIGYDDSLSTILNLDGLQNINTVYGSLRIINNPLMHDVSGLSKLREVHGKIEIVNNDSLQSLEQIPTISTTVSGYTLADNANLEKGLSVSVINMEGSVQLLNNPKLTSIPMSMEYVNGDFIISGCPQIWRLSSSYPLKNVSGNINFKDLDEWKVFWGFDKLTSVQGNLNIQNCGINSFFGLHNIDTIWGDFTIDGNNNLEQINSLNNLHFIRGQLSITNNNRLKDISNMDSIEYESLGSLDSFLYDIILTENDSLQLCNTELFCRLVSEDEKQYHIQNNGQGCSSPQEINHSCTTTSTQQLISKQFQIYPNPFQDHLNIQVNNRVDVRIYSIEGHILYMNEFNPGNYQIDLQNLSPGMYLLMFGNEIAQKLIKL
jgi:hypothetical protein